MAYQQTLTHHGIKGMKWGVRRYQNEDGTLTDAGKKRRTRATAHMTEANANQYRDDPHKWVRDDISRSRRLTDETATLTNKLKTANDNSMKKKPKAEMDLSQMSDKELRDQINRKLLEKQYNDMFAPDTVSKGQRRTSDILEVAGTALAVTSSALGIALAIKELTSGS